jgi:hypothetical protein
VQPRQILARRLHNQGLASARFATAEAAVRTLLAVQSQDLPGARWGVGQRVKGATDATIQAAYDDGRILRTHVLRPTWHFVTPDDIGWLLELTAPRVRKLLAGYDRNLDIERRLVNRAARILEKLLRDGQYRTRAEIAAAFARAGIEAAGQRLAHLVMHAELDGLICSGPMRGKQLTYALLAERAPQARRLAPDEALAELAQRYIAGHGPATVRDLAWWSGLTQADANRGIEIATPPLSRDEIDGRDYFPTGGQSPRMPRAPHVRLLPNYDEYLIAYRDNDMALDPGDGRFFTNDALAAHFVVIDGRVTGGWRRKLDGKAANVDLTLFRELSTAEDGAVHREWERYRAYLGVDVKVGWSVTT